MLPQLKMCSGNESTRSGHVADTGSSESFSYSDTGSVGQVSSSSGKFEEAMEMYYQSMAIRRRNMSASGTTMRSLESNGRNNNNCNRAPDTAESNTVYSSTSSRGPQLRPTTLLTCVYSSLGSSAKPTPQQQQQQVLRSNHRLPSLVSQPLPPPHSASTSSSASATPTSLSNPLNERSNGCGSSSSNNSNATTMAVVRRSTRRPLSRNRALSSLVSNAGLRGKALSTNSSMEDVVTAAGFQRRPSCLLRGRTSGADDDNDASSVLHQANSVLGSPHQIMWTMSDNNNDDYSMAKHLSTFHSRGSSANSDGKNKYNISSKKEQVSLRRTIERGKNEAAYDPPAGSYDVLGLDSMLLASQDDIAPIRHLSLYTAAKPRRPSPPSEPPKQRQQKEKQQHLSKPTTQPSRPTSTMPRRCSLTYASTAGSTSLITSEPSPAPPSNSNTRTVVTAAPATSTAKAQLSQPLSTEYAEAAPLSTRSASLSFPLLRMPAAKTSVISTSGMPVIGREEAGERLPSTHSTSDTTSVLTKLKMSAADRSVSQAGLSSAVNKSESRNASNAICKTSRRELINSTLMPLQDAPTALGKASLPPSIAPTVNPIGVLPVPDVPAPALGLIKEKQTAQFYNTASLARTYDGSQFLNDYILLSEIGSGATGRVVLAFSTSMMCSVAIKIISRPREKKYRLQRSCCSSDSHTTDSNSSERLPGTDASAPTQVNAVNPVPPNGLYDEAHRRCSGATTTMTTAAASQSFAAAAATPSRRKSVSTRLTTTERMARNLQREINVMKDLNHPNIVRLYEVINDPKANSLFLILQYVDSGAIAQLNSSGCIASPFPPDDLIPIATQVIDGLVYLHEHRIVHRDIKPENILVNRDGQAFLADFGVAELMNAESGLPTAATLAYQGTPLFMAPEIYAVGDDDEDDVDLLHMDVSDSDENSNGRTSKPNGATAPVTALSGRPDERGNVESSTADVTAGAAAAHRTSSAAAPRTIDPYALDVWALGVTFYTLLVGHVPFSSILQIRQTVRSGVEIPQYLPEAWRDILKCTMEPDEHKRVTSAQLKTKLHAMRDAHNANTDSRNTNAPARDGHRRYRNPLRHAAAPAAGAAAVRLARNPPDDDEDVILGSSTPTDAPLLRVGDSRLADNLEDFDCSFSINSSVLDVLRPVRR